MSMEEWRANVAKAMVLRDSRLDLRRIQPGTTGRQSASLHLAFDRKGVRTVSRGMARSGSYGLSQGYCVAQNDMPLRRVARTLQGISTGGREAVGSAPGTD